MPLSVNRRLQIIKTKVGGLASTNATAQKAFNNTSSVLDGVGTRVHQLEQNVTSMSSGNSSAMDGLGSRVQPLEQNVTSLALVTAPEVAAQSSALTTINDRLASAEQNTVTLQQNVDSIHAPN